MLTLYKTTKGKSMFKKLALVTLLLGMSLSFAMGEDVKNPLTKQEILEFQNAWGESIVAIGDEYQKGNDYKAFAIKVIDTMYAYDDGGVLFKPTKASEDQFRESKEEALSYFVGGDKPEDHGFAIHTWSNVRFENHDILIDNDSALVMGNYYFTDEKTNKDVKVEFTFGLKRAKDGRVVANLHHSSIPYTPSH
jgi:hypothetical protein